MRRALVASTVALAMALLAHGVALAGVKQAGKGVYVDDFEDGALTGWDVQARHVEVEKEGENWVLELGGKDRFPNINKVLVKDVTLKDFSLEVRLRKHQFSFMDLGLTFRNGCQVVFRRRPGVLVIRNSDGKGMASAYEPGYDLAHGYRKLKVVCAGPIVRVFVDGVQACQYGQMPMEPGPVGLCVARGRAYFDDVKLLTSLPEEAYVDLEPKVEDACLVFPPDKGLALGFQASNHSDAPRDLKLGLAVRTWDEKLVKEAVAKRIRVAGGGRTDVTFDVGRLPEGYYKMVLAPSGKMYPLVIQHRGSGGLKPPDVNIGVYWYFQINDMEPIWRNTYMHAAARDLKAHGFNTVVMGVGEHKDKMDILAEYGIACVTRSGGEMDHPAVIGTFVGDEPHTPKEIEGLKQQYLKIRETTKGKFITTNIVCDGGVASFQEDAWKELVPIGGLRICRWYNMKKCYFGPERRYGQRPSFTEFLTAARTAHDSPFWPLVNTFGPAKFGAKDYYGFPTGPQVKAAMHLTFAYGGKGFVCFTYQPPWAAEFEMTGLVHALSLEPFGDTWPSAGEAARKIARHAELIKSLSWGGYTPWWDRREIEVTTLQDEAKTSYFYAVNVDPVQTVNFRLMQLNPANTVEDLYAQRTLQIVPETVELYHGVQAKMGVLRLTLGPGEGKLLKYIAPNPATGPRVKYPDWVERVPGEKRQYLIDLKVENDPRPDWVHRGRAWDAHNKDWKLYTSEKDAGRQYDKSLYAHAETEIVYALPEGYTHFVAAAGFGDPGVTRGSVIFRVLVDGKEKYRSAVYRLGPLLPVVVDIEGAKKLELVTEDAGDGIYHDYVWWGEARLVKR